MVFVAPIDAHDFTILYTCNQRCFFFELCASASNGEISNSAEVGKPKTPGGFFSRGLQFLVRPKRRMALGETLSG